MKNPHHKIAFILVTFFIFSSCSKPAESTAPDVCDNVPKDFTTDVNPLIQTYCNQTACHDANSVNGPGPLTNYTEVFNARDRIKGQVEAGLMPQNTTLTTAQKNIIICWINSGAPNN
jgi:hypothetical protein